MKAVVLVTHRDALRLTTVASPEPAPGQVLVRIHASGANPLDVKIKKGEAAHAKQPPPSILGLDMAGVVESVGAGVDRFRVGDEVYGMVGGVGGAPGTLAELAAVSADLLAPKPRNLSMREAAALPLVTITAWEGLVDRAAVRATDKVLVLGGGGVGQAVVQIARSFGAEVYAVDSAAKRDVLESLGATFLDRGAALDVGVQKHTAGRGFDVIYDTVGGPAIDTAFVSVRRFGRVVSCLGWSAHDLAPLSLRAASYAGVFTLLPLLTGEGQAHHGEILDRVTALIEAGALVPRVDPRRFDLEKVEDAHRALTDGSARGKIVVDVVT